MVVQASLSYDLFFSVTDGQNANTELITLFMQFSQNIDGFSQNNSQGF